MFYENLQWTLIKISAYKILFVCGDFNSCFNGHIGKNANRYEGTHGGRGFGRQMEGEIILEFAVSHNLVVSNSLFIKRESHLVAYQSGENRSQIDYILVKQQNIKLVLDVKVIPNEECVTRYKLLVCDAKIVKCEDWCQKFVPKWCVWKLQQADPHDKFCKINDTSGEHVVNIWSRLKQG